MSKRRSFLKGVFCRRALSHRMPVSRPDNRAKRAGSEVTAGASSHLDIEIPCTSSCGPAQHGPSALACPPSWAVMTCYCDNMAQELYSSTNVGRTDMSPAVAQSDVFGSPPHAGDISRGIYCDSCVQGVPEMLVCSSSVLCLGKNARNELPCGEYIFSDVPCDLARHVHNEVDPFFEFSDTEEGITSLPSKASPRASKHVAIEPLRVLERMPTAGLDGEINSLSGFTLLGRRGNFPEDESKNVVLASEQSSSSLSYADRDALEAGTEVLTDNNFRIFPNKASDQRSLTDAEGSLRAGVQSLQAHPLGGASAESDVHEKAVLQESSKDSNQSASAAAGAMQTTSGISRYWRMIFYGDDSTRGVTNHRIIFVAAGAVVLLLTLCVMWFFFLMAH